MDSLDKVLLIDDDRTTLFYNKFLFQELNLSCDLHTAENGKLGLGVLEEWSSNTNEIVLILLDINMPVMNGFEFIEEYEKKGWGSKPNWKLIMLTTSTHSKDVERAHKYPSITSFESKPITPERLLEIIKKGQQTRRPEPTNLENLKAIAQGNDAFLIEMIAISKDEFQKNMEEIAIGLEKNDYAYIKAFAHKFKNGLRTFQATAALEVVCSIESACDKPSKENLEELHEDLKTEMKLVLESLSKLTETLDS